MRLSYTLTCQHCGKEVARSKGKAKIECQSYALIICKECVHLYSYNSIK